MNNVMAEIKIPLPPLEIQKQIVSECEKVEEQYNIIRMSIEKYQELIKAIKKSNVKLIPKGTTLLSFKLSIGKTAIAGKDLYTNEAIAGLIPNDNNKLLDMFLFYIFKWQTIDLDLKGNNAFGKSLNSSVLKQEVKIPLPPLEAQENIVQTIESVENEITKLKEQSKTFESKKAEILKSFL